MELPLLFETEGKHAGRLVVAVSPVYFDRVLEIPGAKYGSTTNRMTVPKTWPAMLSLGELAKSLHWKVRPSPEVLSWAKEQTAHWGQLSKLAGQLRIADDREENFYLHQHDGAAWLLAEPANVGRLLLDEMGTGKTGTVIKALLDGQITGPILITCPEAVMEAGWVRTFQMLAPQYRVVVVTGTIVARRKILAQVKAGEYDVAIIGHSNLRSHSRFLYYAGTGQQTRCIACGGERRTSGKVDEKGKPLPDVVQVKQDDGTMKEVKIREVTEAQCEAHVKELNEIPWQVVVCDEAHRFVNAGTKNAQSLKGVTTYCPSEPLRWALTGTPISARTDQLWSLLHWISPESWPSKSDFVKYYCNEINNFQGFREIKGLKPHREAEFQRSFTAVSRRVLTKQVLNLPPLLRWEDGLERRLTMGTEQKAAYKQMRDEMQLAIDGGVITASNAAMAAGRLSMLATATGTPDPTNRKVMQLRMPSCKVEAIVEDFSSGLFEKAQVGMMFASRKSLQMVRSELIRRGLFTAHDIAVISGDVSDATVAFDIKQFQSGKKRLVMLTYARGGTGITLTAASWVLAVERSWSPVDNNQGVARFHRIGSEQHEVVRVIDYVVSGTNEVRQLTRLDEKAEMAEQVLRDRSRLREWFE